MTEPYAGLVEKDGHTHAIRRDFGGDVAVCGGGPIIRPLPGFFAANDPLACPDCVKGFEAAGPV